MVNPRALTNPGRLKVFLVAGEASGDAYGAQLLKDLNVLCLDNQQRTRLNSAPAVSTLSR